MGLSNVCAILGYGFDGNPIAKILKESHPNSKEVQNQQISNSPQEVPGKVFNLALRLYSETCKIVLRRFGDPNTLSFLHVNLVFLYHLTFHENAMSYVAPHFPWKLAAQMLNTLLGSYQADQDRAALLARIEEDNFPSFPSSTPTTSASQSNATIIVLPRPLPDDFALRGFSWVEHYFPKNNEDRSKDWFANDRINDDEKYFEMPSMTEERKERCLWLGCRIAKQGKDRWLQYDIQTHTFSTSSEFEGDSRKYARQQTPTTPTDTSQLELGEFPDATHS